jgi:uncharacterized membrane protein YdjX (TVP38/TMEM64 family)
MGPAEPLSTNTPPERPRGLGRPRARAWWLLGGLITVAAAIFVIVELNPQCAWEAVQGNLGTWQAWVSEHKLMAVLIFFLAYALATALPIPSVTAMSLLSGALFGQLLGTAVASLAYTTGVTVAFLLVRWAFRQRVLDRFGGWLGRVERGIERDGAYYLLTLRVMPSIPFFLVNALMALTPIRTRTYVVVSWIGVLPITFLYAGVGRELASIQSPSGILSLSVLGSLAALAVLPLVVRKAVRLWARPEQPEP